MSLRWYVLRSKPNKEDVLWQEVSARNYEVFYPQICVQPVNPRSRKILPYFPGYMFVHIDMSMVGFSDFTWMPYSYGLVTFGSEPSSVPDGLILALHRRVDEVNYSGGGLYDDFMSGEEVMIEAGPFTGYKALFDSRLHGNERVRVLLKLLGNQQIPLELPTGQIKCKN